MQRTIIIATVVSVIWMFGAAVGIAVGLPRVAEAQTAGMRAEGFVIVDPEGSDRGALEYSTNPQGQPISTLRLTQGGVLRVRMETGRNGPEAAALTLRDQQEQTRIRLALATGQGGQVGDVDGMDIFDREQRVRVHIGVDSGGEPSIQLFDADGGLAWSIAWAPVSCSRSEREPRLAPLETARLVD